MCVDYCLLCGVGCTLFAGGWSLCVAVRCVLCADCSSVFVGCRQFCGVRGLVSVLRVGCYGLCVTVCWLLRVVCCLLSVYC